MAKRIGYGIRSVDDPATIKALIDNKVYLEVCPDSNLDTRSVSSIDEHPIKELVDAWVLVTISTDNRTISNTSLEREYNLLRTHLWFTNEDILQFNLNAIETAFISEDKKQELRDKLLDK